MTGYSDATELQAELKDRGIKVKKTKSTVLFRRGEKASGVFIVLSGIVSLDLGVDGSLAMNRTYGTGALLGLPATLTMRSHNMTATVIQDAEFGFWPAEALDALLRKRLDLCRQLLAILGERISQTRQVAKAFLNKEKPTAQNSNVV